MMFSLKPLSIPSDIHIVEDFLIGLSREIETLVPKVQSGTINISFLPDEDIRKLNAEYRHIDKTTDVLSFHYFDDFSQVKDDEVIGEIVLSESRITIQALEHGHSREKEAMILILHGVLHILGFDHEMDEDYEEMWRYEKELREKILI